MSDQQRPMYVRPEEYAEYQTRQAELADLRETDYDAWAATVNGGDGQSYTAPVEWYEPEVEADCDAAEL